MADTNETAFNLEFANMLRGKHPRWQSRVAAEQSGIFKQRGLRPDIVIFHPGGLPVVVETEFEPARSVERDALDRLPQAVLDDGDSIEQAVAVRVPSSLRERQDRLADRFEGAEFRYCAFFAADDEPKRWPRSGWIGGTTDALAGLIERLSESERLIATGMKILEQRIRWSAFRVLDDADLGFGSPLPRMAELLHQKSGEQTARMAMAIVANAVVFQNSIASAHNLPKVGEFRGELGHILDIQVWQCWQRILRDQLLADLRSGVQDPRLPAGVFSTQDHGASLRRGRPAGKCRRHQPARHVRAHVPAPHRRSEVPRDLLHAVDVGRPAGGNSWYPDWVATGRIRLRCLACGRRTRRAARAR